MIDDAVSAGGLTNSAPIDNQIGVAAGLAAGLGDNGGSTQTIALLAGSPAINTGAAVITGYSVPTTDQRGSLRNPNKINGGATIDVGCLRGQLVLSRHQHRRLARRRNAEVRRRLGQQ